MNDIEFFKGLLMGHGETLNRKLIIQSDSSHQFWLRIMNECVRRRFLKSKEVEERECIKITDFQQFRSCVQTERASMKTYMTEMEFFRNKYDTCVEEGLRARYPLANVETVCGNKMIKYIRSHNDLL